MTKVQSASLHFFLGSDEDGDESEDDENVCFPENASILNLMYISLGSRR